MRNCNADTLFILLQSNLNILPFIYHFQLDYFSWTENVLGIFPNRHQSHLVWEHLYWILLFVFLYTLLYINIRKIKLSTRDLRSNKLLNFEYLPLIAYMVFDNDSFFFPVERSRMKKYFMAEKLRQKIKPTQM